MRMPKPFFLVCAISMVLASCSFGSKSGQEQVKTEAPKPVNVVGIINSGDVNRCSELKENDKIANCKNNVYLEKAMAGNDPTACDHITETGAIERCKVQIYLNLALTSGDAQQCEKIPGKKEFVKNCKNQIMLNRAYASKNETDCDAMDGDENIILCKDNIKIQSVTTQSDAKICKGIHTESIRTQCEGLTAPKTSPTMPSPSKTEGGKQ